MCLRRPKFVFNASLTWSCPYRIFRVSFSVGSRQSGIGISQLVQFGSFYYWAQDMHYIVDGAKQKCENQCQHERQKYKSHNSAPTVGREYRTIIHKVITKWIKILHNVIDKVLWKKPYFYKDLQNKNNLKAKDKLVIKL